MLQVVVLLMTLSFKVIQGEGINEIQFKESAYNVTILENMPIGTIIAQVEADNPGGKLIYSLAPLTQRRHGNEFGINGMTGEIFVKRTIDYEEANFYTLNVLATLEGTTTKQYVRVFVSVQDVNDNPPRIAVNTLAMRNYGEAEVHENSPAGVFLAHVSVADPDSGVAGLVYCRLDDPKFGLQQLFETEYKIVTETTFDREKQAVYNVKIECMDRGNPHQSSTEKLVVVILDENDHAPTFSRQVYTAELTENNIIDTTVVKVSANDPDTSERGLVQYYIAYHRDLLKIDRHSGVITTNAKFDFEQENQLEFVVIAHDEGYPTLSGTALLRLNILDANEPPIFEKESYEFEVDYNSQPGTIVGKVSATDTDSPPNNEIIYEFKGEPNSYEMFVLDRISGEISTAGVINRENQRVFHFAVVAEDSSMRDEAKVTVRVTGANDEDNDQQKVEEDSNICSVLLKMIIKMLLEN